MDKMLPKSYGVKFDFEVKTDTRAFDLVEAACEKHAIKHEHRPERPTPSRAIGRAIAYLDRVCLKSIEFPAWSPFHTWTEKRPVFKTVKGVDVHVGDDEVACTGRNPNYSLKITEVKQAKVDTSKTWRINIACSEKKAENMGHVLSVTYEAGTASIYFTKGTDEQAWETFGAEVKEIVAEAYNRFATHYNDEDIRAILDAEMADMHALKVIKATNRWIPWAHIERAKALYKFAEEVGQEVSWLGLDNEEMTRDSLLRDVKAKIFADMDEYEKALDKALNTPTKERKRGEAQRERMYNTAMENIDKIFAQAEYYADVLGYMAEEIVNRRAGLKSKATEFLTRDFDAAPKAPAQEEAPKAEVSNPEDAFAV